jgi:trans-aconitate methyltransferase
MKTKIFLITIFLASILFIGLIAFQGGKWDRYYKNKMSQPPRQLIVDALRLFENKGTAIDLGCGIGNETTLLINQGWQVWAIDSEPKAIQLIKSRSDITGQKRLTTAIANYEKMDWNILPQVDFFFAANALPFCNPSKFEDVWKHIMAKIIPGGRFAGHFFGLNYQGFDKQEMKVMTFLTREEVLNLFKDFDIEYFQESEEDGQSGTGRKIHSHIFEVIARKK